MHRLQFMVEVVLMQTIKIKTIFTSWSIFLPSFWFCVPPLHTLAPEWPQFMRGVSPGTANLANLKAQFQLLVPLQFRPATASRYGRTSKGKVCGKAAIVLENCSLLVEREFGVFFWNNIETCLKWNHIETCPTLQHPTKFGLQDPPSYNATTQACN